MLSSTSYDQFSLWICARRMEKGRLHWPSSEDGRVQLTREEFALLIGGIDMVRRGSGSGIAEVLMK
jgi:transposase